MNDLYLAVYIAHIYLFGPKMDPIKNIHTLVNNTDVEGWSQRGSVRSAIDIGYLL